MSKIKKIKGRQIFDSRGNPTIEVDITLEDGSFGRASVPSGASTGAYEAYELRDGEPTLSGKTVLKAVEGINTEISNVLYGMEASAQEEIDNKMIELDSTNNKSRLGANAILGVSMASSRAQANSEGKHLFEYLNSSDSYILPVPMMNLINGGAHSNNSLFIQEFMIMPVSAETFNHAIITGSEIFHSLKSLLENDGFSTNVGDEGGVAPDLKTSEDALSYLCKAIEKAGYRLEEDIVFALDIAASELYNDGQYFLSNDNASSSDDLIDMWDELTKKYPIFSIEDLVLFIPPLLLRDNEEGELVCKHSFPSMPKKFWNDRNNLKYKNAYFNKFKNIWYHGDYAERKSNGGYIIYGRSDATLNPGGVRIGTAEIYSVVEKFKEIKEALVVGQNWDNDVRIILFLIMNKSIL